MRSHFQGREPFLRDLEDRGGFLSHIGFRVMVACLEQFSTLVVAQGDFESFGHGGPFWKKQMFQSFYHMPLAITNLIC
jgi:cytosine/uracil/thiamine/allantoin permease